MYVRLYLTDSMHYLMPTADFSPSTYLQQKLMRLKVQEYYKSVIKYVPHARDKDFTHGDLVLHTSKSSSHR